MSPTPILFHTAKNVRAVSGFTRVICTTYAMHTEHLSSWPTCGSAEAASLICLLMLWFLEQLLQKNWLLTAAYTAIPCTYTNSIYIRCDGLNGLALQITSVDIQRCIFRRFSYIFFFARRLAISLVDRSNRWPACCYDVHRQGDQHLQHPGGGGQAGR